ncbi:MAG: flavodoxin family protein [Planctomycetaceae bacterium]|jgi:multimeric flavodoxin WrbA|nr:flavodoxin family protein [Planctomycetaceae bacterium]
MSTNQRREFLRNAAVTLTGVTAATAVAASVSAQDVAAKKRNVIGINTSHRTGKTCADALKIVLENVTLADPNLETELIELAPLNIGIPVVGAEQPKDDLDEILTKISAPNCIGLVLATPVYFGLPSTRCVALIDRLMPIKRTWGLRNKIFGGVVVGAARNGGQETLLHALANSMLTQQMILAVDSAPTSHWGATLWSQKDSIAEDESGQNTAKNLGKRIAELAAFVQ